MNYSVTQQANFVGLAASVGIIIRIFSGDSANVTPEEWQIVGVAVVNIIANIVSYINRFSKGDVNAVGKKM